MKIIFKSNKFRKQVHDDRLLIRAYGKINAKKMRQRLDDLLAAETLEDVRNLPGRYHELKAGRKGQIACDLEHPYRLIFEPVANPMPIDENGQLIWSEITFIEIIEIVDYH
jgi:proteic killer suppression protein